MEKKFTFAERLRELLVHFNITQTELSLKTGISKSSVSRYIKGDWEGKQDAVFRIASAFGVSEAWLMGVDVPMFPDKVTLSGDRPLPSNILPMPKMVKKPLLGTIACGTPILAVENIEENVDVPDGIQCDFVLRCKGDSMIDARIFDGDLVYLRQQEEVENGQIAAILIDDGCESEATLKRVYLEADRITLVPENRKYQPFVYVREEMDRVRIIGKAVAFTSTVR